MNIKKNIPNLFTLGNLFCGCIAIVLAFEGNLIGAAYMVGIAGVFDFLDGLVARILKVNSEIGKQLDSLADVVSFGVVPGVIIFKLINQTMITSPISFFGFLVTIFSAIRLAKFNIDTRQTDSFIGLPVPANAIFIASLPLSLNSDSFSNTLQQTILNPYCLILLSLISSFLLVAPLPLFALKFKNFCKRCLLWCGYGFHWSDSFRRYRTLCICVDCQQWRKHSIGPG